MKNPNWRTRQNMKAAGGPNSRRFLSEPQDGKLYLQNTHVHDQLPLPHERNSFDSSALDPSLSDSSLASEGFVRVLQQIDLNPVDGRQMSIFKLDVRAESPTPTAMGEDRGYIKISRYRSEEHQRNISSSSETGDYLHSLDQIQTPDSLQSAFLEHRSRQISTSSSSHIQFNESRSIFEKKQMDVGLQHHQVTRTSGDCTPISKPAQTPSTAIRNSRDQAFQRLIQRLNRDSQSHTIDSSDPPINERRNDQTYEPEKTSDVFTGFRQPMGGSGRRDQTISDFRVDYWDNGLSSVTSHESHESHQSHQNQGDFPQATIKQSSWNPKAREFLSLGSQQSPRRWETERRASPNKPAQNFHTLPLLSNPTWLNPTAPAFNAYPLGHITTRHSQFNPSMAAFNPALSLGIALEPFGPPGILPSAPALVPVAPLPTVQAPLMQAGIGNFPTQQAEIAAQQQLAALPYLASLASLGIFNAQAGLEKPKSAIPMRRPPVAKPTLPDASAQLAYEEWIEWRKANEPGYAIECKARQQRRCHKTKTLREGDQMAGASQTRAVAAA